MTPDDINAAREYQRKFDILLSDYQEYGLNDDLAGEIFDAACYVKDYLTMALKALEVEREERCKDMCYGCRSATELEEYGGRYIHRHSSDPEDYTYCEADALRQRAARIEQKG